MASTTPAKKATKKATPPARTRAGAARTAAAPAVVVEEEAVQAAAARPARPRPAADRPAAKAAAALRQAGESEPTPDEPEVPGLVIADDDDEVEPRTATVPFKGRDVEVMLPTQEQLTMYHRLSREFQGLARTNTEDMSMEDALRQLDRATRLVQSVMKDQLDRDWLEDQLLEGKVTLGECTELLKAAFQELHKANEEQQDRATRRKASRARLADA